MNTLTDLRITNKIFNMSYGELQKALKSKLYAQHCQVKREQAHIKLVQAIANKFHLRNPPKTTCLLSR